MKTHTTWTPTRLADGSTLWTAPTGHTYLRPARPFLPHPHVRPPAPQQRDAAAPIPLATTGYPATGDTQDDGEPPF